MSKYRAIGQIAFWTAVPGGAGLGLALEHLKETYHLRWSDGRSVVTAFKKAVAKAFPDNTIRTLPSPSGFCVQAILKEHKEQMSLVTEQVDTVTLFGEKNQVVVEQATHLARRIESETMRLFALRGTPAAIGYAIAEFIECRCYGFKTRPHGGTYFIPSSSMGIMREFVKGVDAAQRPNDDIQITTLTVHGGPRERVQLIKVFEREVLQQLHRAIKFRLKDSHYKQFTIEKVIDMSSLRARICARDLGLGTAVIDAFLQRVRSELDA